MAARRYGRRLRRGAAGTAVAAAAMAALSASQAPGFLPVAHASSSGSQAVVTPPPGPEIDGGSPPYVTELPPLNTPTAPADPTSGATGGPGGDPVVTVPGGGANLPATVLAAYQRAQESVAETDPGCHLPWQLLAAIGQVESGQARGGAVDANGTTYKPILGPVLNGNGFADITDTDGGAYDGDAVHDRAVGPMQFIPSTWATWGADGNGDGVRNPNNVYDAALAAAHYLCADGRDLAVPRDMDRAILGYNHSQAYLDLVRSWYDHFRQGGAVAVPDRSGTPGAGVSSPPPATPKPSTSPSPSPSASPSATAKPQPTATATGTVKPTQGTTPQPTTSPTGAPPTTGPTTEPPTDDPTTTPGCPTDGTPTPTPTPTDSGELTEPPTVTEPPADDDAAADGTGVDADADDPATPDPCATGTDAPDPDPTDTPAPEDTAGAATGPAVTNEP